MSIEPKNLEKLPKNRKEEENNSSKAKYRNFKQIVNTFYNEEIEGIENIDEIKFNNLEKVKIEPKILYDKFTNSIKVEFKIGFKRMYRLKNLVEFYDKMMDKEFYRYGDKLQFLHIKENFEKSSQELLAFILASFIASFSERFIPSILEQITKDNENNTGSEA